MFSVVEFEHGDTTCASKPGKFCRFLYTRVFGTKPKCVLFEAELHEIQAGEFKGWLGRCDECFLLTEEKGHV